MIWANKRDKKNLQGKRKYKAFQKLGRKEFFEANPIVFTRATISSYRYSLSFSKDYTLELLLSNN